MCPFVQVWNLRIDVNMINHDGNLIDCASIATLAALMHFHRPDVTSTGEEVIIHPASEKDYLPLTLFHYPVCISFITFKRFVEQAKIYIYKIGIEILPCLKNPSITF